MTPEEMHGILAERAMGETIHWTANQPFMHDNRRAVPQYSASLASAWPIAEWLRRQWGGNFVLQCFSGQWQCKDQDDQHGKHFGPKVPTPALAICYAALDALGVGTDWR